MIHLAFNCSDGVRLFEPEVGVERQVHLVWFAAQFSPGQVHFIFPSPLSQTDSVLPPCWRRVCAVWTPSAAHATAANEVRSSAAAHGRMNDFQLRFIEWLLDLAFVEMDRRLQSILESLRSRRRCITALT
jgi:hypothetical protein